ncbi:alanine--glyoxylate aminotransferase family protein [Desulfovibrionales bacterium]
MRNKLRLLTPGPTPLPEEVRLALAKDMIHHRKADFIRIMERIQPGLQTLFSTTQQVLPLSCSGTGAMYAAISNLVRTGETVLVVEGGKFGERWREIAQAHGTQTISLVQQTGEAVAPHDVAQALDAHPEIRAVLVQASETSTGVRHPIQELGAITALRDVLLIVDGISAVGISPCPMDAWNIDCLLTGSQKGLMLPPGLALVSLSERAWTRVQTYAPTNFYFNLLAERDKNAIHQTLFTSPVNLLQGLAVSLDLFASQGLSAMYHKQWALTCMARAGLKSMGLELVAPIHYTWGLTSVWMPAGVSSSPVLAHAAKEYGVVMAGGQGELKNSIVRLGHMGYVDWADVLAGLHALQQSLLHAGGYTAARRPLEDAMHAYEQAWRTSYPVSNTGEKLS